MKVLVMIHWQKRSKRLESGTDVDVITNPSPEKLIQKI